MAFEGLREFLHFLEEKGDLVRVSREVDRKYEIGYGMKRACDTSGPALLFENVRGYRIPVLGALYGTRRRCLWALGSAEEKVHDDFIKGMKNPIPPATVGRGSCREVVWTGDQLDLNKLPIPWVSPKDGGYFVNLGLQFAEDPVYGRNVSVQRCHVLGGNRLGMLAHPPQHLGVYISRAEERGEPLEVALAIGVDPVIVLASQVKTTIGVDETAIAGGIRGRAVELVKCETNDVKVPADAEIVVEGRVLPKVRHKEGPFGEYTGYYGKETTSPVLDVTAITMREDPIYQACSMPLENDMIVQIPSEATLLEHVRRVCPTVKAVHFTVGGGCQLNAVISIRQTFKEEAKRVIVSAFGSTLFLKNIIVVDDDIDVRDPTQVEWAMAFRCQPIDDVIILPKILGAALDPSAEENLMSGMGIDATKPFGVPFAERIDVPEAENFEIPSSKAERV